jgi:hypothetical protein
LTRRTTISLIVIEKLAPFNHAGEFVGGGASFWDGGIHLDWIILS